MNSLGLDSLLVSEKVLPYFIYKSVDHCLQVKYTRYTRNHLGLGYSVEKVVIIVLVPRKREPNKQQKETGVVQIRLTNVCVS